MLREKKRIETNTELLNALIIIKMMAKKNIKDLFELIKILCY